MRWRPQLPAVSEVGAVPHPVPAPEVERDLRSATLVEALARLETATRLRDGDAAARILEGLTDSEDGQWLLRQCVAAGLREVANHIADPSLRSIGPAA
jgi:hypothetical protein